MSEKKVYDPVGSAVILTDNWQDQHLGGPFFQIDATPVIAHPIWVLETTDGTMERYYFRTMEENSLLIKAKKIGDAFIVNQYQLDPSVEQIRELIKRGKQVYKSGLK